MKNTSTAQIPERDWRRIASQPTPEPWPGATLDDCRQRGGPPSEYVSLSAVEKPKAARSAFLKLALREFPFIHAMWIVQAHCQPADQLINITGGHREAMAILAKMRLFVTDDGERALWQRFAKRLALEQSSLIDEMARRLAAAIQLDEAATRRTIASYSLDDDPDDDDVVDDLETSR